MQSGDKSADFPPPPPPPPPFRSTVRTTWGSYMVLGGIVFAFCPILITLVGSIFVDDALNESASSLGTLPWLTFLTAPIGGVIALVGLVARTRN